MKTRYGLWTSAIALTLTACTTAPTPREPQIIEEEASPAPPVMDMARLMSEAVEPEGPGTQLGPYPDVTIAAAPGLPTHTVYYPSNFADAGDLPVLIWGLEGQGLLEGTFQTNPLRGCKPARQVG